MRHQRRPNNVCSNDSILKEVKEVKEQLAQGKTSETIFGGDANVTLRSDRGMFIKEESRSGAGGIKEVNLQWKRRMEQAMVRKGTPKSDGSSLVWLRSAGGAQ